VLVEVDGGPDDQADDHLLVVDADVEQDGAVADQGDEEGADDGPDDPALPPEQAGAADDRGRDDVEFQRDAVVRLAGVDPRGGDHAAQTDQHTRQDVHVGQVAAHPDARPAGGFQVGPHGVGVLPEAGLREQERDPYGDHRGDHHGERDTDDLAVAEQLERPGQTVDADRAGHDEHQATADRHRPQRRDERGYPG